MDIKNNILTDARGYKEHDDKVVLATSVQIDKDSSALLEGAMSSSTTFELSQEESMIVNKSSVSDGDLSKPCMEISDFIIINDTQENIQMPIKNDISNLSTNTSTRNCFNDTTIYISSDGENSDNGITPENCHNIETKVDNENITVNPDFHSISVIAQESLVEKINENSINGTFALFEEESTEISQQHYDAAINSSDYDLINALEALNINTDDNNETFLSCQENLELTRIGESFSLQLDITMNERKTDNNIVNSACTNPVSNNEETEMIQDENKDLNTTYPSESIEDKPKEKQIIIESKNNEDKIFNTTVDEFKNKEEGEIEFENILEKILYTTNPTLPIKDKSTNVEYKTELENIVEHLFTEDEPKKNEESEAKLENSETIVINTTNPSQPTEDEPMKNEESEAKLENSNMNTTNSSLPTEYELKENEESEAKLENTERIVIKTTDPSVSTEDKTKENEESEIKLEDIDNIFMKATNPSPSIEDESKKKEEIVTDLTNVEDKLMKNQQIENELEEVGKTFLHSTIPTVFIEDESKMNNKSENELENIGCTTDKSKNNETMITEMENNEEKVLNTFSKKENEIELENIEDNGITSLQDEKVDRETSPKTLQDENDTAESPISPLHFPKEKGCLSIEPTDESLVDYNTLIDQSPSLVTRKLPAFQKQTQLKLEINRLQQIVAHLELSLKQKERTILKQNLEKVELIKSLKTKPEATTTTVVLQPNVNVKNLENLLRNKQDELNKLELKCKNQQDQIESLTEDCNKSKNDIEKALQENKTLSESLAQAHKIINKGEANMGKFLDEFRELVGYYTKAKKAIEGFLDNERTYKGIISQYQGRIKLYEKAVEEAKNQIEEANKENQKLKDANKVTGKKVLQERSTLKKR